MTMGKGFASTAARRMRGGVGTSRALPVGVARHATRARPAACPAR